MLLPTGSTFFIAYTIYVLAALKVAANECFTKFFSIMFAAMIIPITFEFNGKTFSGEFSDVMGAGSNCNFHLHINNFYCGRLKYSEFENEWVFDTNKLSKGWEVLAEHFGYHLIAWYVSQSLYEGLI